ncbi:MAG: hypothetical protein V4671_03535 [Armatimonadota bacterium]
MITGRRTVLAGMLGVIVGGVLPALPARSAGETVLLRLDFGGTTPVPASGYSRVLTNQAASTISAARPWGWNLTTGMGARNRNTNNPLPASPIAELYRDFIFGPTGAGFSPPHPRTLTIGFLTPGRYRLTFLTGDHFFGDHTTRIVTEPAMENLTTAPSAAPATAHYATVTATVVVPVGSSTIKITFDTVTGRTWVINSLVLESVQNAEVPRITIANIPLATSTWTTPLEDPTVALLAGHRVRTASFTSESFTPTELKREDYLSLIAGQVDFWKNLQNPTTGAIIDPDRNVEFQYSTPAYAHAAATLVAYAGRTDLLETAALALDWSARTLSTRRAASGHEDFFTPMVAHSIRLLKPFVSPERSAQWEYYAWFFEPYIIYRYGAGVNNWNVVAACGEALLQKMGIRDASHTFVEESFAKQGDNFDSTLGLYLEEAMAYDHFPRLWIADLLANGYNGAYSPQLDEAAMRGSLTSLFMQSPSGELPSGGRSAHHQWNEAAECVTFEVYAARALADGDSQLAGYFKRAAHLALGSMWRWVRPNGEMQIVKNWVEPSAQHGYETYSAQSQYSLLPMSMLSMAYEHAAATEGVAELPAPADTGGFVLQVAKLDKVFANAGGSYVEIETKADRKYDATGLIRVHFAGHQPQLGPSDSLLSAPAYVVPSGSAVPITTGIGVSWQDADGNWLHQGELTATQVESVSILTTETAAEKVAFSVRYEGNLGGGVTAIEDQFVLTPGDIRLTTVLFGSTGPIRRAIPLLADDGRTKSEINVVANKHIQVSQKDGDKNYRQSFRVDDATTVTVGEELYPNHNGWARLAIAEYVPEVDESESELPEGAQAAHKKHKKKGKHNTEGITLRIKPQGDDLTVLPA